MLFFAIGTYDMLEIAHRAVDIMIAWRFTMEALTDNDVFIRMIDRNGDSFVKYVAFTVKQTSLYFRVLAVSHNAAIQLAYIVKPFFDQKTGQLFATDTSGAVRQIFLSLN